MAVDGGQDLAAVGGLPDHLDVGGAAQQQAQAAAHQRVVVDDQDPDHGSLASTTKSPAASGPAVMVPPASVTRSSSPTSPLPAPGSAAAATPTGRRLRTVDAQVVAAGDDDVDGGAGRVLARVGQALLDDAVGGAAERLRDGRGR